MSSTRTGLTPPKTGSDIRVGRELGRDWGWILARTQRAERLLAQPAVMEMADELARYVDRYCVTEGLDTRDLEPDLAPTKTKTYMTIRLGGKPCAWCSGTGVLAGVQQCGRCEGTGHQTH